MTTPLKPILVCTQHRGVFAGLVPEDTDMSQRTLSLKDARMFIYWGTTRGVMELAETGPTSKSRVSAKADIPVLHDVTAVFAMTNEAWERTSAA